MKSVEVIPVLNQLLQTLCGSLPIYLSGTKPWVKPEHAAMQSAIENLVADQERYGRRVADAIADLDGNVEFIHFPTDYTAKNDLALEYLMQEIIDGLEQDISTIEQCAVQLSALPALHSLAEEILGNARGHLEILQEASRA